MPCQFLLCRKVTQSYLKSPGFSRWGVTGAGCWASGESWVAAMADAGEKVTFCFGFLSLPSQHCSPTLRSFPLSSHAPRPPRFSGIFVPTLLAYKVIIVSVSCDWLRGWRERAILIHLCIHLVPNSLPCTRRLIRVKSERSPKYLTKRSTNICAHKGLYTNFQGSTVHNSPKLITTQVFVHQKKKERINKLHYIHTMEN